MEWSGERRERREFAGSEADSRPNKKLRRCSLDLNTWPVVPSWKPLRHICTGSADGGLS